jgi:Fic family protein
MIKKSKTKPFGATSYKETAFGIIPRAKLLRLELKGTKKGLEFIQDLVTNNSEIEITSELILKIHEESFAWIFPDWAGKYRTIRVEFSGKETILPHQIHELMVNLCLDLNERLKFLRLRDEDYIEKVVELLAWFQHRFVWIHPFQDYNGRIARMFTILILLILRLPPVEIKVDSLNDRKRYLEAMYAADEGDFTKLENLISNALIESLVKSMK